LNLSFKDLPVVVTDHAIKRFKERWSLLEGSTPKDSKVANILQRLLDNSRPEELTSFIRVRRLINNGFKDAEYYVEDRFRLVLIRDTSNNEDCYVMVTVELSNRKKAQ